MQPGTRDGKCAPNLNIQFITFFFTSKQAAINVVACPKRYLATI